MSGERPGSRDAVDRVTKRIVDEQRRHGFQDVDAARRKAVESAKRIEKRRDR